jgi:hypothetical protein
MKARVYAVVVVAWLFLFCLGAMSASASTFVGGTTALTLVNPPTYCANARPNGCFETPGMAYVNYRNNLNSSVLAIVLWVIHNNVGQTVGFGAATVSLAPGANATAYPIVFGLAPGAYSSMIFAISSSGVAISSAATLVFSLSS